LGAWLGSAAAGSIPAPTAVAKGFPAVVGDRDRVLQFDEAATRMRKRRLNRDDHARLKRAVDVMGRIWDGPVTRQPRRLMADETHPMRHELD
jgi:hypothetical protein